LLLDARLEGHSRIYRPGFRPPLDERRLADAFPAPVEAPLSSRNDDIRVALFVHGGPAELQDLGDALDEPPDMTRRLLTRSSLGLSMLLALIAAAPAEIQIDDAYINPRMR
jgi:hypothetical protein